MDERDLTGRDIEEAKNWGLTPRKYMELREQLNRKFQEADKSKTREDVTKEVYAKAKEDARKELDPREVIRALKDTSSAPRLPESVDPKP